MFKGVLNVLARANHHPQVVISLFEDSGKLVVFQQLLLVVELESKEQYFFLELVKIFPPGVDGVDLL